jgi:hypothetical protein
MNRKTLIAATIAMALLAFGAAKVHAQADVPETCALKATIYIQNTNSDFFPGPPTVLKFTTKELLALIAKDENTAGNYGATNFPSGAKLIKFGTDLTVWDSANNSLLPDSGDVTFVAGMSLNYGPFTAAGSDSSVPYSETDYGYADVFIYDLDVQGGVTDLTLSGFFVNTIKSSAANQTTGAINSSQAFTMKAGGGTGAMSDKDAAITGGFSAKGTGTTF